MTTYSCGNCGYILPGPVGRCPRCGALLRGEREGDEAERQRREREYRRNSPEARARRAKLEMLWSEVSVFLIILLVIAVFIGGGAALGWFVLPLLFGRQAVIPLTVASAIMGGLLLYLVVPFFKSTIPSWLTGKPDWLEAIDQEVSERERTYQLNFRRLIMLAYFFSALLLGSIGRQLESNNVNIIPIIGFLGGLTAAYLAKRILGSALELWNLVVILVLTAYGINQGLTFLFDALSWSAQISKSNVGVLGGILAGLPLSYFLAKRLVGHPPDTWKMRKDAIIAAIAENPARISALDSYDRDYVLTKLKELAEAAPDAWKLLSPELQKLVPSPQSSAKGDSGKEKKSSKRGAKSPKKQNTQDSAAE